MGFFSNNHRATRQYATRILQATLTNPVALLGVVNACGKFGVPLADFKRETNRLNEDCPDATLRRIAEVLDYSFDLNDSLNKRLDEAATHNGGEGFVTAWDKAISDWVGSIRKRFGDGGLIFALLFNPCPPPSDVRSPATTDRFSSLDRLRAN